jgi:hypothetical protein
MIRFFFLAGIILTLVNTNNLIGRWESKSPTGVITGVVFKSDNSFEGYVNRKPFVTGTYSVKGDTLRFTDNGCGGSEGVYKLVFYSNADSLRCTAISDTCTERRNGMQRLLLGRIKQSK